MALCSHFLLSNLLLARVLERPWCWERWRAGGEGVTEDEMVGWHHRLNGHEFEQTLRDSEGQGSLACCSPWCCKESDAMKQQEYSGIDGLHFHDYVTQDCDFCLASMISHCLLSLHTSIKLLTCRRGSGGKDPRAASSQESVRSWNRQFNSSLATELWQWCCKFGSRSFPSWTLRWLQPSWHFDWEILQQKTQPSCAEVLPYNCCEIIHMWSNPLHFGVICYVAKIQQRSI